MIEFSYNNSDYQSLHQLMARNFYLQQEGNLFRLPEKIGVGFLKAYNLQDGVSVSVSDVVLEESLLLHRQASTNQQYFIIQFNQSFSKGEDLSFNDFSEQHIYHIKRHSILLTSSMMESRFFIPKGIRVRSVRIILSNDLLMSFAGRDLSERFLSNYFSMLVKNRNTETIGTEYRAIMEDLVKEEIEHPLEGKFVYTRAMLMIERLITGFISKLENNNQFIKLKDDEINRLIKVESLLVRDFSGVPPTIPQLSKIAAMSPTKLKRDFKAMFGLPIYEYYQKNRMLRAKALLLEGKYAVKEVGMMVGYSNLGHFAGSFKKEFGALPSEIIHEEQAPIGNDENFARLWNNE